MKRDGAAEPEELGSPPEGQAGELRLLPAQTPRDSGELLREVQAQRHELQVHQIELELQNEELSRANLELEETRAKYLDLFEFAPVGYLTLDRQGIVQEANLTVCSLLGVQRERLLNRRFPLFVAPESRSHLALLLRRVFESPEKRVAELTLERAGRAPCHAQVECVAFDDGGHAGTHCRVAIMDITPQRQAQDAVLRLNQTLEERVEERTARLSELGGEFERFAQSVAQDLLSPLRHITSFAALVQKEDPPASETGQRHLNAILSSAARMNTLIHALIDVSRASNSRMRLTQVDLGRVLTEVRKELRPLLEGREVTLTSDPCRPCTATARPCSSCSCTCSPTPSRPRAPPSGPRFTSACWTPPPNTC